MAQVSGIMELTAPLRMNVRRTNLTEEQFIELCQENPELRLELTAHGELVIMPPTGSESGWRSGQVFLSLGTWAKQDGTGLSFDSSTGFTLPNGAIRSPDASWIQRERWTALTKAQREKFAPICPDFVIEVRSVTDRLSDLLEKMQEYLDNGARLGWLIDPIDKRAYVYRPGQPVEILENPQSLSGDPVLPGFRLNVQELW
ncbi:MAG TPA: Uma2 family endonuclease [Candidatus Binatia bacterium]|nr:Uma2 family endonuclease [Candidatus Binatia bacterium]